MATAPAMSRMLAADSRAPFGTDPSLERLGRALLVAAVVHAAVVFGVSFSPPPRPAPGPSTLDVILVASRAEKAPDKADFLAQANQEGGGESEKPERPSVPLPAPFVGPEAVIPSASPPPQPTPPEPEPTAPDRAVLTQAVSEHKAPPEVAERKEPRPVPRPRPDRRPEPAVKPAPNLSADLLVARSLEMASLNAEIDRKLKAYAERPVRKFINARTREFKYAAYMDAWRAKVERVGNLNYPDEARRQKLSGNLLLDVALSPDGSVNDIQLRRSSGHKVLDDAAIRIVRLASPFPPFPKDIEQEVDILHIERTWQFIDGGQLLAR